MDITGIYLTQGQLNVQGEANFIDGEWFGEDFTRNLEKAPGVGSISAIASGMEPWVEVELGQDLYSRDFGNGVSPQNVESSRDGDLLTGLGDRAQATPLHSGELDRIADAAIARWGNTEFGQQHHQELQNITFEIEDLSGAIVGQARGSQIFIDPTAAGYGWFADATPLDDTEFTAAGEELYADRNSMAFDRMDLLTVVTHEIGHVLGLADIEGSDRAGELMHGSLVAGERRLPENPQPKDFLAAGDRSFPHNLEADILIGDTTRSQYLANPTISEPLKTAIVSGLSGVVQTLDNASETLGNELLSIPGLMGESGEGGNLALPGLLGNAKLGSLLQEQIINQIDTKFEKSTLAELETFIDNLEVDTSPLQLNFSDVSVELVPVEATANNQDDYELLFDFTVNAQLSDRFKLDLGKNADLYGIDLGGDAVADLLLNTGVNLDLSFGSAATITEGNFGGPTSLRDTKITLDSDNFFIRQADLQATASIDESNLNFDFQVGFLDVRAENGSFALDANISANLLDPSNSDGLNRITLSELNNIADEDLTTVNATGNLDILLPVKVNGIDGIAGDFFDVNGATIALNTDVGQFFGNGNVTDSDIDPRMSLPVSVSAAFEEAFTPFNNIGSADIVGMLRRIGNQFDKVEAADAFNIPMPFAENKTLGDMLGLADGMERNLINRLLNEKNEFTFDSVQKLAVKLAENLPLDIQEIGASFDKETQELRFKLNIDSQLLELDDKSEIVPVSSNDVPIDFDLELGELGGFETDAEVKLTPDFGVEFTFGIDLSGESDEIAIAAEIAPDANNGQLTEDVSFRVKIGENAPIALAMAASDTADNNSVTDLISDIEAAIAAAGISDSLNVKAMSEGKGLFLTTTEPFLQVFNVSETAKALGFFENQTAAQLAMVGLDELAIATVNSPPANGKPGGEVAFNLELVISSDDSETSDSETSDSNTSDGNTSDSNTSKLETVKVNLLATKTDANSSNTSDNQNIYDLVEDLNSALTAAKLSDDRSLGNIVFATVVEDKIVLKTTEPNVESLKIVDADAESGLDATVLGFSLDAVTDEFGLPKNGVLSGDAVFTVKWDDRTPVTVTVAADASNANAVDPIAALIEDINTALGNSGIGEDIVAGRNGDRLILAVEGTAKKLEINPISDAAIALGIQENFVTQTRPSVDVFIEDAKIDGSLNLLADKIAGSAEYGFVGIDINGSGENDGINDADVTASVNVAIANSEGNTKFVLGDPRVSITDLIQVSGIDWSGQVMLRDIDVQSGVPGLTASDLEIPINISNTTDSNLPSIDHDFSNLSELLDFQEFDFAQVVEVLQEVATFLSDRFESLPAMQNDLPLVGVRVADLLTFTDKFAEVVSEFEQNPAGIVQDLNNRLVEALGLPQGSDLVSIQYDAATSLFNIDLNLFETFSDSLGVDLDLGAIADIPNVQLQGAAGLQASGGATAKLSIGIDLSNPTNPLPFLNLEKTDLSVELAARGNNLSFVGALGPVGVFVNDGVAAMDGDGNAATTDDFAELAIALTDPTPGDNRILFDEFDRLDATIAMTGGVDATLPIFFPSESNFIGDLGFSVADLSGFLTDPTNPANFNLEVPDLSAMLDNADLSLLNNLHLAIEGIDSFFGGLQTLLETEVFDADLPLIGDKLGDAATFIEDIRSNLYNGLRDRVDNSIAKTPELIQESLFEILGTDGLNLLQDGDGSGAIDRNDIAISGDPNADNFLQWDMTLGSNFTVDEEIALDLGLPALGLEIDGGVNLDLGWELDFGFGLNREEGFYFALSDDAENPEVRVNLNASIPGLQATGSLGFLKLNVSDRQDNPTHLNANFAIDLVEKGATGEDATKLGLFEMGNLGVTPTLTGGAKVHLDLRGSVLENNDKNSIAAALPSIVSEFDLVWTLDTADLSGNIGKLETVAFNNVGLDLGSFISDFLNPIVGQIQEITEPVQPIIDVLTNRLPVISDLAGKNITLIDLAEAFGYGGKFGMIDDIANIVKLINDLPENPDSAILPFGSWNVLGNNFDLFNPGGLDEVRNAEDLDGVTGVTAEIGSVISSENATASASPTEFIDELKAGKYGGLDFPIFTDPSQVFQLLIGQPANLLTYDMEPMEFEFEYGAFFSILGPLGAEIIGTIGAGIDLGFGFDTYGGQRFAEGNYQYPIDILRGFYVRDRLNADATGPEVPELNLYGSLVGAGVLHAGIAKGGVGGGVFANIDFDLNDPNSDGKVRIEEILNNIYLGSQDFSPSNNPITSVFDVSGSVEAKLKWFVEALSWKAEGQIGPSLPLLNFNYSMPRPPVLASELGGGVLRLNMGDYAGDRLHENTTDGDEHFTITQNGNSITVSALGQTQTYKDVSSIVALGGSGNDTIIFENVTIAAEIDGGFGDDRIDWGGSSGNATIIGGSGSDTLSGGSGDDALSGEKGIDRIFGGGGNDNIAGGTEADILSGDSGNDTIAGGEGDDSIAGGANTDYLDGGTGSDRIWGDSTLDINGTLTLANPDSADADILSGGEDNDELFGDSGNDTIGGGSGSDRIEGNSGEDEIWGDSDFEANGDRIAPLPRTKGHDTLSGNEGSDRIFGEDGNDLMRGHAGNDTLEGNFGADTLLGDENNDRLNGGADSDLAFGGADSDRVEGDTGNDILFGDKGVVATLGDNPENTEDDAIAGDGNPNQVLGFTGDSDPLTRDIMVTQIDATDGDDTIDSGAGDDIAFGGTGHDRIFGDILAEESGSETPTGEDILVGDGGRVSLRDRQVTSIQTTDPEYGGDDAIAGNNGDDIVFGGAGNDELAGNDGNDIALGDNGVVVRNDGSDNANDIYTTDTNTGGNDRISGDAGEDILIGGDYHDEISGNDGDDVAVGDHAYIQRNAENTIERIATQFDDAGGNDQIQGNTGNDNLIGGIGNDRISGNDGNDVALGDNGQIIGNDGSGEANDIITKSPEFGGTDEIFGNAGEDILVGGSGGNDATGIGGDRIYGNDGDDVAKGDNARIFRTAQHTIERIETTFPHIGGDDVVEGNSGGDALLGGFGTDTLNGLEGTDIILGDNGELDYTLDANLNSLNRVTTTNPTQGDRDLIAGGNQNDLLFGGTLGDNITAGEGNDLVFGDHGKVEGIIQLTQLPLNQPNPPFTFTAIDTHVADKGGDEWIQGDGGDDIILGQQGSDRLYGDRGDDDIIGGHNVVGGDDTKDTIDGGTDNDAIAGDNASILRSSDTRNPRMRALSGQIIYDAAGNPQVTSEGQPNPTNAAERQIELFDHHIETESAQYGNDAIAGGAGEDAIFGQLGNDVIQGDSSVSEAVSATNPSVERNDDGDDYIEGNGGEDLIFGNSGQDDIIGGSSSLFGNDTPNQRPDGEDTVFGGAGTELDRNHMGDESPQGHAKDADAIAGDNANIFRLVGTNGTYGGDFLTFTYDNYSQSLRIVPRAIATLDYTPGDSNNAIGGHDLIYGETSDDAIYGMTGNDVLFGNGQDDDIFGGMGYDRIYGGTGEDGILGDDGRIFTSRNGETESLYGLNTPDREGDISIPGPFIGAIVHESGRLKKEARWIAFDSGANDVIYGGLGDDFLHGGAGDDAISGAEALAQFYNADPVTDFDPLGYDPTTRKLTAYDAYNPRQKIDGFLLNFEATDANGNKIDDGKDYIFGDNDHDWLVGGTRNDRMFGGMGDDLLDADDNRDTNGGSNDRPDDPEYADADFAFGGGGLDVLMANTGGDRLFDWTGEFNSFLVPFSPFGNPTIVRSISPHVVNFLLDLGDSSGADQNLAEPNGELGLVTQKDPQWGDQHGAPRDPQPGNLPGVQRDTQGAPEGSNSNTSNGNGNSNASGNSNRPPQATNRDRNPGNSTPISEGAVPPNASENANAIARGETNPNSNNNGNANSNQTAANNPNSNNNGNANSNQTAANNANSNNNGNANSNQTPANNPDSNTTDSDSQGNAPTPTVDDTNSEEIPPTEETSASEDSEAIGTSPDPVSDDSDEIATPVTPPATSPDPVSEDTDEEVSQVENSSADLPEDDSAQSNNGEIIMDVEVNDEPIADEESEETAIGEEAEDAIAPSEETLPETEEAIAEPEAPAEDPVVDDGNSAAETPSSSTSEEPAEAIEVQQTYTSSDANLAIPDMDNLRSTLDIGDASTIVDVNLQLSLAHDRTQDLEVFLEHPQGTRVQLFSNLGNKTLTDITLDDEGELPIAAAGNPNVQIFRPEGNLSEFEGLPLGGLWTLEIRDTRNQKTGILNSWSMVVTHKNG
ncbi:proprotein convertase P-domain-containing protein [Phormidium sp. CCY1219]|uniref:proprotein convertase P-domain-containing protein n=1 Tax=Phormidium sp. CCY1219 TaxID=2886104 RepID=UPI002D1E5D4A|nr:proprotein convertase P-domain-containing protein [Phormidium sp. CCY1219]MEB3829160.1 proprotein convertase P-domain-containing protein [Phormidium sp. CCY1219]